MRPTDTIRKSVIICLAFIGIIDIVDLYSQEIELFSKLRANDINAVNALIAAGEDNEELIKYMIKIGANVNAKSKEGNTPLLIATEVGNDNKN